MDADRSSFSRTAGCAAAVGLAIVLAGNSAHADESAAPSARAATPEKPSRWYGWQTLAADGGAAVLVLSAVSFDQRPGSPSTALAFGALGTYALGGPIIHLVHQNYGRSAASLGMRVGGPILLAVTGAVVACGDDHGEFCGLGAGLLGASLGVVTAITVDAAVFAYDDEPEPEAARPTLRLGFSARGVTAFGTF